MSEKDLEQEKKQISKTILEKLRQITRLSDLNSKQISSTISLTSPQLVALLTIYEHGPMTLAKLSEKAHLSPSTMVGVIDRLEAKQYLLRTRSATDRRQVLISITSEGKKIAQKSPAPLEDKLLKSLDNISINQRKNIVKSLETLVDMLQ